jgi:hypothetical protein
MENDVVPVGFFSSKARRTVGNFTVDLQLHVLRNDVSLEVRMEEVALVAVLAIEVLLTAMDLEIKLVEIKYRFSLHSIYIHMRLQQLPHEELLPALLKLADKLRLSMNVEMSSKIVHTRKEFPAIFAGHLFGLV